MITTETVFYPTQVAVIESILSGAGVYHVIFGGVGGGKSTVAAMVQQLHNLSKVEMVNGLLAYSNQTVEDTLIPYARSAAATLGLRVGAMRRNRFLAGGNIFTVRSGHNVTSKKGIQGGNWHTVWIDEAPNVNRFAIGEATRRVRVGRDRKIIMTANPADSAHFFTLDFIDEAVDKNIRVHMLQMDENPALDAEYAQQVAASAVGGEYDRYVLGRSAPLYGLVYAKYEDVAEGPGLDAFDAFYVTVDPGYSSATHALLIGRFQGRYWVIDEKRFDFVKDRYTLTDEEQCAAIAEEFAYIPRPIALGVCDSASPGFRKALAYKMKAKFIGSYKGSDAREKKNSIDYTKWMFEEGHIRITPRAPVLLREIKMFSYDDKGMGGVIKSPFIHGLDALRYFVYSVRHRGQRVHVDKW